MILAPSESLILSILGYLYTFRTQNLRPGSSATVQMVYKNQRARYTNIIGSLRISLSYNLRTIGKIMILAPLRA